MTLPASRLSGVRASIALAILLACAFLLSASTLVRAQQYSIIHNFTAGSDGFGPAGGMAIDSTGTIYGVTQANSLTGTVYQLKPHNGSWVLNTLYTFTGGTDGGDPQTIIIGPDGALYGSAGYGGPGDCPFGDNLGCGYIFRLRPPATPCRTVSCPWTKTILYTFTGAGQDGAFPVGQIAFDAAGSLYGATSAGGGDLSCERGYGCGAIFKLTPSGGQWTESILYSFRLDGAAGWLPQAGVTLDAAGNLYGTTYDGPGTICGGYGCGTVYELTPSGSIQTLYRFEGGDDGAQPTAGVTFDNSGDLFGTTSELGSQLGGTIFELIPGGSWRLSVLYSFYSDGGYGPLWNMTWDGVSNFYGTTSDDGISQTGNVFQLARTNAGWQYTDLHDFLGGNDGAVPEGGVVVDATGNIYGSARFNGPSSHGVIWMITP